MKNNKPKFKTPQEALRYHVTGVIERGEAEPIVAVVDKPKHTPGPWVISKSDVSGAAALYDLEKKKICSFPDTFAGWDSSGHPYWSKDAMARNQANAQLIAAAPEMLEALEKMTRLVEIEYEGTHFPDIAAKIDEARQAIAKARGES